MSQKIVYQLSGRQILFVAFASALLAVATVASFTYLAGYWNGLSTNNVAFAENAPPGISEPSAVSDEQNNIEVYKTLSPGVAFITSTTYSRDFFGQVEEGQGSGSGSVIDAQGHILTNHHVIEGAQKLTVSLGGDKVYPAKVVGSDPDTDLAVLQIEMPKEGLTIVPFGDSDKLMVGQKVLAIGNPFGLDRTLTTGVISGLQRPIRARNGRPIEGAIQTDASINPGNSGGPLLDKYGKIIGINSQILSPAGGSVGVGFAIPVNIAKRVVAELIQFGEVRRPKLGAGTRDVSDIIQQGYEMPVVDGLLILNILPGGSAEKAGLRGVSQNNRTGELILGDIILSIDSEKMNSQDDLYRLLDKHQIGDTIQLQILRAGKTVTVAVKLQPSTSSSANPTAPRRF